MDLIADGLLLIAAVVASIYCLVLSKRLRRLNQMDGGLGKAIATMSTQVEEMSKALATSRKATEKAVGELDARLAAARDLNAKLDKAAEGAGATATALTRILAEAAAAREATNAAEAEAAPAPAAKPAARKPARKTATAKRAAPRKTTAAKPAPAKERDVAAEIDAVLASDNRADHEALARRLIAALAGGAGAGAMTT